MIHRILQLLANIGLGYRTVSKLRVQQILYLIWYRLFRMPRLVFLRNPPNGSVGIDLMRAPVDSHRQNPIQGNHLTLLNITASDFLIDPDWELDQYGKLWTYNLSYFDFLESCDWNEGHHLMIDFATKYEALKTAKEPYPCSLRVLNWVKFLSHHKDQNYDLVLDQIIWKDTLRILKGLELHLAANHMMENGFGLFYSALFFRHGKLQKIAERILNKELRDQFHTDGGHYEQSLMYHSILLERMLDCLNLIESNKGIETSLYKPLRQKTQSALSFLSQFTEVRELPLFNDAADGVARTPSWLYQYGESLGVSATEGILSSSGFRKLKSEAAIVFVDAGNIGPTFQPGHAHADSLTFCLYQNKMPLIIDTGTSTYNIGARRSYERSTEAHNTVVVNGKNSSEVWGGFRVGRQANAKIKVDEKNSLQIIHDGYQHLGFTHQRSFLFTRNQLLVRDEIIGSYTATSESYLHFDSSVKLELKGDQLILNKGDVLIQCKGFEKLSLEPFQYARVFNHLESSLRLRGTFFGSSSFTFIFDENQTVGSKQTR